ncbi:tas [Symbiodinium sp. CCMP2592]|nr:tas [Symbiodinium sp. CCMP2592]
MWLVGVGLVLAGLVVGTCGMHLIRKSELKNQSGHVAEGKICFAAGIFLNLIIGPVLDVSGYAFAPASIISPFTGFNIIANSLVAPITLGEQVTRCRCIGIVIVFVTATLSVFFNKETQTEEWTLERAQDVLLQWRVAVYGILFSSWLAMNVRVLARCPHGSVIRGFCLGAISGSLAGNMWCTRLVAVFVKDCFNGSCGKTWSNWLPWLISAGAAFFAITNVPYMQRAMRKYEALFVVTVFQGSSILTNSLSAVIVLREMDGEPWWTFVGYFLCIGGMIVGMLVLTRGEEDDGVKASHGQSPTASRVSSGDSLPPAFVEFVHAGTKILGTLYYAGELQNAMAQTYFSIGKKRGQCHWEINECLDFEDDSYLVFDVTPTLHAGHVTAAARHGCSLQCALAGEGDDDSLDEPQEPREGVDLLITEEGWGLSSANWLIRRSEWSIAFLERAFRLCHDDMPLFGDQDAMIHLLLNSRALSSRTGDALDPHAVIVPQRELNAYDATQLDLADHLDIVHLIAFPVGYVAGWRNRQCRLRRAAFVTRKLGSSSLTVTEPCLGTMTWGVQNDEAEAHEQLDYAVKERGVNFIDTAEMYPVPNFDPQWCPGTTEEYIGNWLHKNPDLRDKVVLATKVVGRWPKSRVAARRTLPEGEADDYPDGRLDEKSVLEACDASLRRLKTDCIDLYQVHWPDRYVPIFGGTVYKAESEREAVRVEETAGAMKKLLDAGKIKAYGVSNETTFGVCEWARAADKLGIPAPASIQNALSMVVRLFEYELAEACSERNLNIGLMAYSILAGGPRRVGLHELKAMHEALESDGAVIVTGVQHTGGTWEEKAAALPSLTFPGRLVSKTPKVQGIHLEHQHLKQNLTTNPFELVGKPLLPHTDGYIYGEFLPDYIAFVVESQSDAGGQNFVVDGNKVLERLCEKSGTADAPSLDVCLLVRTQTVDLTERSPPGYVNGRKFTAPLMWHQHQRLRFHRQVSVLACEDAVDEDGGLRSTLRPYQSLWSALGSAGGGDAHQREVAELLEAADAAVQREAAAAPRFMVREGEALVIDNYRMLHGREGYQGATERKLWRVWFWSNESSGIPEGMPELGSVLDAEELSLLSGKYLPGKPAPPKTARHVKYPEFMSRWTPSKGLPELNEAVEAYAKIAEEAGMSLTDLSTRWCRTRSYCKHGSVIIGATSVEQLKENLDAFEGAEGLSEEVLQKIDDVHLIWNDPNCERTANTSEGIDWDVVRFQLLQIPFPESMAAIGPLMTRLENPHELDFAATHCVFGVVAVYFFFVKYLIESTKPHLTLARQYYSQLDAFSSGIHPHLLDRSDWLVKDARLSALRRALLGRLRPGKGDPGRRPAIYVYEHDIEMVRELSQGGSFCGKGQWGMEVHIHEWLLASPYLTKDPEVADFFFVPAYSICMFEGGFFPIPALDDMYKKMLDQLPYFRRNRGRDHIFTFGSGLSANVFPSWRQEIPESIQLSPETWLFNDVLDMKEPCFNTWRDIAIPGYLHKHEILSLHQRSRPLAERKRFAVFLGRIDSSRGPHPSQGGPDVRAAIRRLKEEGKIYVAQNLSFPEMHAAMGTAKFCFVPKGKSAWSLRFFEALFANCIPVVLSDFWELPFEAFMDLPSFVIKWPMALVGDGLMDYLESLPEEVLEEYMTRAREWRCWYVYPSLLHEVQVDKSRDELYTICPELDKENAYEGIMRLLESRMRKSWTMSRYFGPKDVEKVVEKIRSESQQKELSTPSEDDEQDSK